MWIRVTFFMNWLRYDERIAGWDGVKAALAREERTRHNYDHGLFTRSPIIRGYFCEALIVADRLVRSDMNNLDVYDRHTGKHLGSHNGASFMNYIVMDRWMVLYSWKTKSLVVYDCLECTIMMVIAYTGGDRNIILSTAGPLLAYRFAASGETRIVMIRPSEICPLRKIDHDPNGYVFLCPDGRTYLRSLGGGYTHQICDIVTDVVETCIRTPPGAHMVPLPSRSGVFVGSDSERDLSRGVNVKLYRPQSAGYYMHWVRMDLSRTRIAYCEMGSNTTLRFVDLSNDVHSTMPGKMWKHAFSHRLNTAHWRMDGSDTIARIDVDTMKVEHTNCYVDRNWGQLSSFTYGVLAVQSHRGTLYALSYDGDHTGAAEPRPKRVRKQVN